MLEGNSCLSVCQGLRSEGVRDERRRRRRSRKKRKMMKSTAVPGEL